MRLVSREGSQLPPPARGGVRRDPASRILQYQDSNKDIPQQGIGIPLTLLTAKPH